LERRLCAILAADVVGYSRLMELDEAGTLNELKRRRTDILEPLVCEHRGRIVKVMGDGVLVEFGSAVNAVTCAIELQKRMAAANAAMPDGRQIVLRIGVNLCDAIVEGADLYGEGVNVAARLQALTEPGGILVSGTAYDHVKNKVDAAFEDLGARALKNLRDPVRVYRVPCDAPARRPESEPSREKPSIAVLPFANLSGDAEQAYFSDGIAEDIVTGLSHFRQLFVISRHSSFQYRDRAADVRRVAAELGVRFIVEGSVRTSGNTLRVTAQLIDAATGSHLWAQRFDRELTDIFAVQDEITRTIVASLAGQVEEADRRRAIRKSGSDLSAYDLLLRGKHRLERGARDDVLAARQMFELVLEMDPDYAPGYIELAETYFYEAVSDWSSAPGPRWRSCSSSGTRPPASILRTAARASASPSGICSSPEIWSWPRRRSRRRSLSIPTIWTTTALRASSPHIWASSRMFSGARARLSVGRPTCRRSACRAA
jgi:adenylate cyclase